MKWASPKRTARSDFWPEARKLAFLRMRSENRPKNSLTVLSDRQNFRPFIRNRGRWARRWGQCLHRKQNWRYFWRRGTKKSPKHSENVFRQKSFSPVTGNLRRRHGLHHTTKTAKIKKKFYYLGLMYKTAVYTLVNGAITHQKPQI